MGYLSCSAESAISTCDPCLWELNKKRNKTTKPNAIREFPYSALESATNGFSPRSFLGKGSHGSVYKAILDDGKLIVAVKKTSKVSTTNLEENEIEILSKIHNPGLVNLIGYAKDSKFRKLIVVEYMPNGSLHDLLHSNPKPPGWTKRVRFALQVAKAVHALHSSNPQIIHRDIKSSNVLVDGNWNARLGDFGLALRGCVEDVRIKCTPPAGTLGYLDPGYLAPEDLSTKSDVFSFGILLLEILSGRHAIDVHYSPPSVVDWALPAIKSGDFTELCDYRIGLPEDPEVIRRLAVLAGKCVSSTAENRPEMGEVVESLGGVSRRIKKRRVRKQANKSIYGHEVFDASNEMGKAKTSCSHLGQSKISLTRNRKVFSSFDGFVDGHASVSDADRVGRSRSVGSFSEIKLDSNQVEVSKKGSGSLTKMPGLTRLSKSRSMGVLQTTRLVHYNDKGLVFQLARD
ncbi:Serine-threonine/tyrosine-protein kinase, catalytic domain [Dillenia turbinata]|uniref:Serine-threonine/tyrosine-protein kinase, catalytic domain n=1 Tax=Dillenia turbinata TaxID=194707 RepID=A0AAN8W197_9MAGN